MRCLPGRASSTGPGCSKRCVRSGTTLSCRSRSRTTRNRTGGPPKLAGTSRSGSDACADAEPTTGNKRGTLMGHRRDLLGGTVLLLIGVILLLRNLGYVPLELDRWWPVILIVIGLGIVVRGPGPMSAP